MDKSVHVHCFGFVPIGKAGQIGPCSRREVAYVYWSLSNRDSHLESRRFSSGSPCCK